MRDELIIRGSLNVIVVDWAGGSLPLYTQVNRRNFKQNSKHFFSSTLCFLFLIKSGNS